MNIAVCSINYPARNGVLEVFDRTATCSVDFLADSDTACDLVCGCGDMWLLAIMWCLALICGHVLVSEGHYSTGKCVTLVCT